MQKRKYVNILCKEGTLSRSVSYSISILPCILSCILGSTQTTVYSFFVSAAMFLICASFYAVILILTIECCSCAIFSENRFLFGEMNASNAHMLLSQRDVLMAFHAPWCGHCRYWMPVFKEVGEDLAKNRIFTGSVDVSNNQALAATFKIRSIPQVFLKRGNSMYSYDKLGSSESLLGWALEGYKIEEPIPYWDSPLSPVGRFKGLLIRIGQTFYDLVDRTSKRFKLSPFAGIAIAIFGLVCILLLFVFSYIWPGL